MKVCYVLSTPSVAGGANRSLLDMIRQLKKTDNNFSCFVILNGHGTMENALQELGINYYIVTYANAVKSRIAWRTFGKRIYNIYAKQKLKSILRNERPDIVHNNSLPTTIGMELALQEKIPYICHIRENVWAGLGMDFYAPETVKCVINNAHSVIAISEYIKNSYKEFHCNNVIVVPDGLLIDDYYSPNREILKNEKVNVLIVGVINPQKGQADAVKAVEILQQKGYDICLTILGAFGRWKESTCYADELKDYVTERAIPNILFMEPINDDKELKKLRDKFDINLICSSAEGLGRTTIESMLSGALTIAANAGATPEIIKDYKTGLLYTSGNIDDLCRCIAWAIENKSEACEIAHNGQCFAYNTFSVREYAEKIMAIYKSINNLYQN